MRKHSGTIRDTLRNLASFAQCKKRHKHPLRSVNFKSMVAFHVVQRIANYKVQSVTYLKYQSHASFVNSNNHLHRKGRKH